MSTQQLVFDRPAPLSDDQLQNRELKDEQEEIPPAREPAAFASQAIMAITAPARDKRTMLLSELTNIRKDIGDLEAQIRDRRATEELKQFQVLQIEDWLAHCERLGQLSHELEPYIKTLPTPTTDRKTRVLSEEDFTSEDCLAIFEANPNVNLSTSEVIGLSPAIKRASASRYVSQRLGYLTIQGKLKRIDTGVYRLVAAQPVGETLIWNKPAEPVVVAPPEKAKPEPEELYEDRIVLLDPPPLRSKEVLAAPSAEPKRRGRPPGVPNRPKMNTMAAALLPHLHKVSNKIQ